MQAVKKKYVTVKEAVEFSSLKERSIRRLLASGELTKYVPVGGRVVIDLEQLENLIRGSAGNVSTRGRQPELEGAAA